MTALSPWYQARQHMVDALVADLHGSSLDQTLTEAPLERFIVGILHPRKDDSDPVEGAPLLGDEVPENAEGVASDAGYDPGVSFAHLRYPSTIGLSVGVDLNTSALEVQVKADRYEADSPPDGTGGGSTRPPGSPKPPRQSQTWHRTPFGPATKRIDVRSPSTIALPLGDGLELRAVVRPLRSDIRSVTLVLVNTFPRPETGYSDHLCWFRPVLRVRTVDGAFADRRPPGQLSHLDPDQRTGELLYRSQRHLAVGHGVAVRWDEQSYVDEIETTFFPRHDLKLARAERSNVEALSMETLAVPGVIAPLKQLVERYDEWITEQEDASRTLASRHEEAGQRHVADARAASSRMRRGIQLLIDDPTLDQAFRTMNAVMREQRLRQDMVRNGLTTPPVEVSAEWRPFQMAFILLNLAGLADPYSEDRDIADLLWFPTGGGKTEAYLGLIALTLVLRRLNGAGTDASGAGVGVIMRYTLRLLTLQQFERAAGLICALEDHRRRSTDPGVAAWAPFSIGLWVGQGATPNDVRRAATALRKLRNGEDPGDNGDPVQLLRCPWSGHELSANNYDADVPGDELRVRCPGHDCDFVEGLPVVLVDSDVYRQRPSLLIGTVDKFAMLAWNERSGRIFGSAHDAPPDLIVQDELHLISGPLGTLVGLYETAIDHLATDAASGSRPKLVASTATIRRADRQIESVFARSARQFPPPGMDASDSFFAVDAPSTEKGTRQYVGLMAPSTSHATLLVRTYAALLQAARILDAEPAVKDAYWTLLGYFNSLRVLGAAYIQTIDDVRDRIKVVARRTGSDVRDIHDPRELTSRKRSSEIPNELALLQTSHPDPKSPDVVLATNMISVGVDVDRLGLMCVMGQPQTTSEYIQATSRVGRRFPGLVLALYNASRSRDLSHYEAFTTYHRSLYKEVEATGATPFATRALDRGLHGVMVALARHTVPGAASDSAVDVAGSRDQLAEVMDVILRRAVRVAPDSESYVRAALESLADQWQEAVESDSIHKYARWQMQAQKIRSLMVPAGTSMWNETGTDILAEIFPPSTIPWSTLTSLRNVDRESTLKIISTKHAKAASVDAR